MSIDQNCDHNSKIFEISQALNTLQLCWIQTLVTIQRINFKISVWPISCGQQDQNKLLTTKIFHKLIILLHNFRGITKTANTQACMELTT